MRLAAAKEKLELSGKPTVRRRAQEDSPSKLTKRSAASSRSRLAPSPNPLRVARRKATNYNALRKKMRPSETIS